MAAKKPKKIKVEEITRKAGKLYMGAKTDAIKRKARSKPKTQNPKTK